MARPEVTGKRIAGRKILSYQDLKARGIRFSRQWIDELIRQGRFPKKVYLGDATVGFVEDEIEEYLESKIAERDEAQQLTEA